MKDPTWHSDNWWWWPEIPLLDLSEDERAVGLISFGAFFMRRWVLDSICKPRWNEVYKKDIDNELRFPTIASVEGAKVGEIHLPFVEWHETVIGDEPGIYHGIKKPVHESFYKYLKRTTTAFLSRFFGLGPSAIK